MSIHLNKQTPWRLYLNQKSCQLKVFRILKMKFALIWDKFLLICAKWEMKTRLRWECSKWTESNAKCPNYSPKPAAGEPVPQWTAASNNINKQRQRGALDRLSMVTTESFCDNHKTSSERGALSLGRLITELQNESDRRTDATQFSQLKVLSSTEPKSI